MWWECIWPSRNILTTGDELVKYLDRLCSCNTHGGRINHDRICHYVTLKDVAMWTHVMSDCVHNRFPGVYISIITCGSSASGYVVKFDLQPTPREARSYTRNLPHFGISDVASRLYDSRGSITSCSYRGLWLYMAICLTLTYVVHVYEPTCLQRCMGFIIPGKNTVNITKDEM